MKRKWPLIGFPVAAGAIVVLWLVTPGETNFKQPATWQRLASPGPLSAAHAHLENKCAACHTSVKGVEAANCIVCHANNESILQRQPTSFHASIGRCKECHVEHQGRDHRATIMDHQALARIGLRKLDNDRADSEDKALREQLVAWTNHGSPPHQRITPTEAILNCAACHANGDRHFKLFGQDCAQCHATDRWTIPEFSHPSPGSTDCAQCHQAPPSHYMEHFRMISMKVAGQEHAQVSECFKCHQTTSWNDIQGVGWYKHH